VFRAITACTWAQLQVFLGRREHRARANDLLQESLTLSRSCELHAIRQQTLELARQHALRLTDSDASRSEH
jgi:hypothetical protein